jgi:hypothetical protein
VEYIAVSVVMDGYQFRSLSDDDASSIVESSEVDEQEVFASLFLS